MVLIAWVGLDFGHLPEEQIAEPEDGEHLNEASVRGHLAPILHEKVLYLLAGLVVNPDREGERRGHRTSAG